MVCSPGTVIPAAKGLTCKPVPSDAQIATLVIYHGMQLLGLRTAWADGDRTGKVGESPITDGDARHNNAGSG